MVLVAASTGCLNPNEAGNLVPETVAEDPDLPAIEVNGTRLHAEFFGDPANPIIVFHHGGPGSDYRALISELGQRAESRYPDERSGAGKGLSRLQDDYYCVFYDQRGSGLSPRFDPGKTDIDTLVDDLDAIIDLALDRKEQAIGIRDEQVTLFGWSFGGVLVTAYTNTRPGRVKDVISFEHGPLTKDDLEMLDVTSPFAEVASAKVDEWLYNAEHVSPDSHARADYMQAVGAGRFVPEFHENERSPFWRIGAFIEEDIDDFDSAIAGGRIVDNLDAFEGRFLYLVGELNTSLDQDEIEQWGAHYPDYEVVEIPGTGHSGPWERPSEVASAMRAFLEEGV